MSKWFFDRASKWSPRWWLLLTTKKCFFELPSIHQVSETCFRQYGALRLSFMPLGMTLHMLLGRFRNWGSAYSNEKSNDINDHNLTIKSSLSGRLLTWRFRAQSMFCQLFHTICLNKRTLISHFNIYCA